eukprot:gene18533-24252_t
MKEVRLNSLSDLSMLTEIHISRSQAKQRAGRAGRVKPGICWRLYKLVDYNEENKVITDYQIPEICRKSLEEVILQIIHLNLGKPESFLSSCLTSPSISQIKRSISILLEMNAILPLPNYPITPLGYHLARLPMDVKLGKLLLLSICLQCLEAGLTLTASLCNKSPFINPSDSNKLSQAVNAHENFVKKYDAVYPRSVFSYHLAFINAYIEWDYNHCTNPRNIYDWCNKNFIDHKAMIDIKKLRENYRHNLMDIGILSTDNTKDDEIVDIIEASNFDNVVLRPSTLTYKQKSLSLTEELFLTMSTICAGLSPQFAKVAKFKLPSDKAKKKTKKNQNLPSRLMQSDGSILSVHPSSTVCRHVQNILDWTNNSNGFIAYHKKMASSNNSINIYDGSVIPIFTMLLFGGDYIYDSARGQAIICGWIKVKINELNAAICKRLQLEIFDILKVYLEVE